MNRRFKIRMILFLLPVLILLIDSCKNKPGVTITTADVSEIKQTTAVSGGVITAGRWGPVTSRGVCWATTTDPVITDNKTSNGNQTGSFISNLTGLQPGTDYYLRAYATSPTDTVYGRNIAFITQAYSTVTDIEGNVYNVISIGKQVWMAENLRTNKYSDSTSIPLVKDEIQWAGLSSPAFCWYKNDEEAFKPTYGALYNWYAVNSGKLCPLGWHIPSDAEWTELTTFLGGDEISGGKLKETGLIYWVEPNTGATNESGFTAFPGGFRYYDGKFFDFGFSAYWWSSGESSSSRAWFRFVYYNDANVYRFNNIKRNGFSVRCIKD
ncbi:MAG: fibrobacter succinogenes major paralogous domain-containing protein [Bacteroidales bacterium]